MPVMSEKAKSEDGKVLPCAEVKERKIRLVGTISRKVMRRKSRAEGFAYFLRQEVIHSAR